MSSTAVVAAPVRAAVPSARRLDRIAGMGGLAFVAIVALQNVVIGANSPPQSDATAAEIGAFLTTHNTMLSVAVGSVPFAVIALYLFVSCSYPRLSQGSAEAGLWARLGAIGAIMVGTLFLTGTLIDVALIVNAQHLADQGVMTEVLWQIYSGSRVVIGAVLGMTLLGLSRAAHLNGVIPGWQQTFGIIAGGALFGGAVLAVPSVDGAMIGLMGFAGFFGWLVWLALTGIRLMRTEPSTD